MLPRSSQQYKAQHREKEPLLRRVRRLLGLFIMLFLVYEFTTSVLVDTVEQESIAMMPTLEPGDRLLALPLAWGPRLPLFGWVLPGLAEPARGDLALVRPAFVADRGVFGRLVDPAYRFVTLQNRRFGEAERWESSLQIKRIVGLPGDTIQIERFVAYVRPAGGDEFVSEFALATREYELLIEQRPPQWQPLDPFGPAMEPLELGDDEYFVLSDNRSSGTDSRHWGVISADDLIARASVRFWPFADFGRP